MPIGCSARSRSMCSETETAISVPSQGTCGLAPRWTMSLSLIQGQSGSVRGQSGTIFRGWEFYPESAAAAPLAFHQSVHGFGKAFTDARELGALKAAESS